MTPAKGLWIWNGAVVLGLGGLCGSRSEAARDSQAAPTVYLHVGLGLSTYKSEAVASNDTSLASGYVVGCYTGTEQSIGMALTSDSSSTAFKYADSSETSKITAAFQSTTMRYRFGWAYAGLLFDWTQLEIAKRDTPYINGTGFGMGANAGVSIPLGRENQLFVDIVQVSGSVFKDAVQDSATVVTQLTSRTDVHLGGVIKLTRDLVDLRLGFRQRQFVMQVGGESFQEVQTMTWLGLGLEWFF